MKVCEYVQAYPDDPFRVVRYIPAPDVLDDNGNLVCGGEGTSTVVFDSTTGDGDLAPDIAMEEITTINIGDDNVPEVEYIPDEYWA